MSWAWWGGAAETPGPSSPNDALTATDVTLGAPVIGLPVLAQDHGLTAATLTGGAGSAGSPALTQVHVLAANTVTGGTGVFGAAELTQDHGLTASTVTAGAPVIGAPVLTEDGGTDHALTATDVTLASPAIGTPTLTVQVAAPKGGRSRGRWLPFAAMAPLPPPVFSHSLVALDVVAGVPDIGRPAMTQTYDFVAIDNALLLAA